MSKEKAKSIPDFSPRWLEIVLGLLLIVIGVSCLGLNVLFVLSSPKIERPLLIVIGIFTVIALFSFRVSYRTFKRKPKTIGSIQCNGCGATTEIQDSFFTQRRLFGASFRTFCPLCWNKRQLSTQKWSYLLSLLLCLFGLSLLLIKADLTFAYICINFFLLQVTDILSRVLHELAHAWTAKALGFRVFKISIGRGKTIYKGKLFGFDIEFNSIPVMGMVIATYPGKLYSKTKHALFPLAGPMMNLILALIGFIMLPPNEVWNFAALFHRIAPVHLLFYTNLLLLAGNLWPRNVMTQLGSAATDGKQLVRSLSLQEKDIDQKHVEWFLWEGITHLHNKEYSEAKRWFEKGVQHYPDNFLLLSYVGFVLMRECQFDTARDFFIKALSKTGDANQQALMKNNIAYADAVSGNSTLLEEADTYSQEALARLSWLPLIKGTRGTVLLELKKIDEAVLFLTDALRLGSESDGKAENCCFLAIAEAMRGNFSKGSQYLNEARKLDPDCFLLKRAEDALIA